MAITATKDLVGNLKKIFNDPATILYAEKAYDLSTDKTIAFDYKLPVTVDTLQVTQDDPTINHYKIIGLSGDWTSSATLGDVSIQLTIPNVSADALKMCFGDDNVKDITGITIGEDTYEGNGVVFKKRKLGGTIAVLASNETDIMLISGTALFAKLLYENPGTDPFAIQLNGGIEVDETRPSITWLSKKTAASTSSNG